MGKLVVFSIAAAICVGVAGCASQDRKLIDQTHQAALHSFQGVSYRRTNGLAGVDDRIVVGKDGAIDAKCRFLGHANGRASDYQMIQLATLFDGWDKLEANYPATDNAPGAPVTEIIYAGKVVSASDAARNLPEQFIRVRAKLENLARIAASGQ